LDCGNITNMPLLRLDDRFRELLAAARLSRIEKARPLEGRCRQALSTDGKVYWTFTWSRPEGAVTQVVAPNVAFRRQFVRSEADGVIEGGRRQSEGQHFVAAQDDPSGPEQAA